MNKIATIILTLIISNISFSQQLNGDQMKQEGKLLAAIEAYKAQYLKTPADEKNTYNLARAFALSFQKDSAFHYLDIALQNDKSLWVLADFDLYALSDDIRWIQIEEKQISNYQRHYTLKEPEYAKELLRIIMKDQALDYYIDQAKKLYMESGIAPHWYFPLGHLKQKIAKDNYSNLQELLEEYGWPKYSTVGELAADAPLLVINHHESNSVRKNYLSEIKQACLDGEGSCIEYAKIQDRVLVDDNKPQIYGMQFQYNEERKLEPFPIVDPEYVDKRRKEIGLESLREYLKRKINYEWEIKQKGI